MRGPLDLSRELLAADVLHEIVHLRRRIDDVIELPDVLGVPPTAVLAVRLYDAGPRLLAALVPAGVVPATTALARAAGTTGRLVPTAPHRVIAVTDYNPSLLPPVGLPPDVRALADAALRDQEVVYTATGDGSTALKIRGADLLALTGAAVARLVEPGLVVDVLPRHAEDVWRDQPVALSVPLRP